MLPPKLDRTLGFLVHDVARLMRKRLEQRTRHLNLTRAQWSVLAHLARHEGINQNGLAEILDVEPITVGRILDRLEGCGLIERHPHPADRRAWLPHLTEKAHPILEQLWDIAAIAREQAMGGLNDAEREQLIELLLRVKSNLNDIDDVSNPQLPQEGQLSK
ncbi:MAG TPA: MarR family transcriptional regulator [Alphaproteobacteria bacterium]|jgi:DNA-binding MarR family transcriptional regulator